MKQFLFILCTFCGFYSLGQQTLTFRFDGVVANYDTGKKEGGVKVDIVQNGTTVQSTTSASNGKYVIMKEMDFSIPFDVVFSKSGLVSKRVNFNMAGLNIEDTPAGAEYEPVDDLSIALFGKKPNVDFSFLDVEPVAQFKWSVSKAAADLNVTAEARIRAKVEKLLQGVEEGGADAEYNKALSEADNLFNEKKYNEALEKYELALGIKPKEKYPKDRILAIDALLLKMKEDELNNQQGDAEYNNLIKAADNFRNTKQYEKALEKYEEALTKKDELYPKDEIKKIQDLLKDKNSQLEYIKKIELADMLFKQKSYKDAKTNYEMALVMKPSEAYPKSKLLEIEAKLKELEATAEVRKKYDEAVAAADGFYSEELWKEAKAKYEEALSYESGSAYVSGRLKLVNDELEKIRIKEESAKLIEKLLSEGSVALIGKKYEAALAKYQEVLKLDEKNEIANPKIAEIEALIAEAKDLEAKEKKFNELVLQGDAAAATKKLDEAVEKYTGALELKEDLVVQTKLADVNKRIEDAKSAEQKEADFKALVEEGKSLFDAKDYTTSLQKYESAKALKPADVLVIKKIDEINTILKLENEAKLKEEKLQSLLATGETQFSEEKWEAAKTTFVEVLSLDPKNETAIQRTKEILAKLAEAKQLELLNAEFDKLEKAGDAEDAAKKYPAAIAKYNEALKLKTEARVQEKIVAVEAKINDLASAAEKDANYANEIKQGDQFLAEKNYEAAKERYTAALAIKDKEEYPTKKIAEIDKVFADAEQAEQKLANLLQEGQTLIDEKKFLDARKKYEELLKLDPKNLIAPDKLAEIQTELDAINAEKEELANFENLKKEGFALADAKKWEEAKAKLEDAQAIKEETAVKMKLDEVIKAISENEELVEVNLKYNRLIENAKTFESDKNYSDAIAKYTEASDLKPTESLPKTKIQELNKLVENLQKAEETNIKYEQLLTEGDELVGSSSYTEAIKKYNEALKLKPLEKVPVEKAKVAQEFANRDLADENAVYDKMLSEITEKIKEEDFDRAVELTDRAMKVRPEDARPKEFLKQIEAIKKRNEDFKALIAKGDEQALTNNYEQAITLYQQAKTVHPQNEEAALKIKAIEELMKTNLSAGNAAKFQEFLENGKAREDEFKYSKALENYSQALAIQPTDKFTQEKVSSLKGKIAELAKLGLTEEQMISRFNTFMKDGDASYGTEKYSDAITAYQGALNLIPDNETAKEKLENAKTQLASSSEEEAENGYKKIVTEADKHFGTKDYPKASELYNRALSIKPSDIYPREKLAEINAILNPVTQTSGSLEPLGELYDNSVMDGALALQKAEEERNNLKNAKVKTKLGNITETEEVMTQNKADERQNAVNDVYQVYRSINLKTESAALDHSETIELVKQTQQSLSEKATEDATFAYTATLNTQDVLTTVENNIAVDYTDRQSVYVENTTNVIEIRTNAEEMDSEKAGQANFKTISNDQRLNQFDIAYSEEEVIKADKQAQNTESIKLIETKSNELESGKVLSDDEERLSMRSKVEVIQEKSSETDTKESEKLQENNTKLNTIAEESNKNNAEAGVAKSEKLLAAKASIDKMESKKPDMPVVINSLGKAYPPGVTEETFQQKDENGIMKAIITRRIVVEEGRGTVYVRTQTLNALTYTKNGLAISEHVWQKETQAAHLQRY